MLDYIILYYIPISEKGVVGVRWAGVVPMTSNDLLNTHTTELNSLQCKFI